MEKIKETILIYNERLKLERKHSISRICNCTELAFLFFITSCYADTEDSFFLFLIIIASFFTLRILHVFICFAYTRALKALYIAMIFFEVVVTGIAFYYAPLLLYFLIVLIILVSFPFLFHKLEKLGNN